MHHKLRVLLVSSSYPANNQDWRGRFIADLIEALARRDDLQMDFWGPPGTLPNQITSATLPEESAWLAKLMASGGIAHSLRHGRISGIASAIKLTRLLRKAYRRYLHADIVHINWLQNALPLWGSKVPALISVLGTDFRLLRVPMMRSLLRGAIGSRRCMIAPNADWMVPHLQQTFGDIAEVNSIPFGVQPDWFKTSRSPDSGGRQQWLVVSRLTRNKIGALFEWGQGLFSNERSLHLFGPMQERVTVPKWVNYHGPTHPQSLKEQWFPHAAGLITLSNHNEGRPQVVLEAMAAGLPVIASDISAHRDIIQNRRTGCLVNSAEEFQMALAFLGNKNNNLQIGMAARAWVKENIGTWADCADRYRKAYGRLHGLGK